MPPGKGVKDLEGIVAHFHPIKIGDHTSSGAAEGPSLAPLKASSSRSIYNVFSLPPCIPRDGTQDITTTGAFPHFLSLFVSVFLSLLPLRVDVTLVVFSCWLLDTSSVASQQQKVLKVCIHIIPALCRVWFEPLTTELS